MIADSSLGSRCNEGIQIAKKEKVTALVRGVENEAFRDGRRKGFNHRGHGGSRRRASAQQVCRISQPLVE
jgi:hypothetical protein